MLGLKTAKNMIGVELNISDLQGFKVVGITDGGIVRLIDSYNESSISGGYVNGGIIGLVQNSTIVYINNSYTLCTYGVHYYNGFVLDSGYDYKDIAILYRTNAQARIFEDGILKKNYPYKVVGSYYFYQRTFCFLRILSCYFLIF